jgi:hypothetical protein
MRQLPLLISSSYHTQERFFVVCLDVTSSTFTLVGDNDDYGEVMLLAQQ